jgi:hypothetical protein
MLLTAPRRHLVTGGALSSRVNDPGNTLRRVLQTVMVTMEGSAA